MTGLQHKVVLITGASGGIGQSLAAEFSRAGTTVVISSRNEEKLRTLAEQLRRDGEWNRGGCRGDAGAGERY